MASNGLGLDQLDASVFAAPELAAELHRVGIRQPQDLSLHRIGNRQLLAPLFESFRVPRNSDYFPFVDQHAARARFLNRNAMELVELPNAPVPIVALLDTGRAQVPDAITARPGNLQVQARLRAGTMLRAATGMEFGAQDELEPALASAVATLDQPTAECDARWRTQWLDALFRVAVAGAGHWRDVEADALWVELRAHPCALTASGTDQDWLQLLEAVGRQEPTTIAGAARALLDAAGDWPQERLGYLIAAAMLGELTQGNAKAALEIWERHGGPRWNPNEVNLTLRLLTALAVARSAH
jgi:hypothetical protein